MLYLRLQHHLSYIQYPYCRKLKTNFYYQSD
nr:MAG TPA: hypothetical protein [Caudoviricetes sp.]